MVLGSQKQIVTIIAKNPAVTIYGANIKRVSTSRNLGVVMDGLLRFEDHIKELIRTCFYRLKVLYRVREYLHVDLRIRLCDSLILSKLSYADPVYGECLLARTKRVIQRIQNACARFCFPIPVRGHVTPYLVHHSVMSMANRRRLHYATLLFGVIKKQRPIYLYEKLSFSNRPIRGAPRLLCPCNTTAAFRGSFRYAATKCWNDLPPPIKNSSSVDIFKKQLKILIKEQERQLFQATYI